MAWFQVARLEHFTRVSCKIILDLNEQRKKIITRYMYVMKGVTVSKMQVTKI